MTPEDFDREVERAVKGERGPIVAGEVGDDLNLMWVEEYKAAARLPKRPRPLKDNKPTAI